MIPDIYPQLLKNLQTVTLAFSSRAIEAQEWLQGETQNNPQMHQLLRRVVVDPNVRQSIKTLSAISLNSHLINIMFETPYSDLFSFVKQIITDLDFSQTYFAHLHRFMVEFVSRAEAHFVQEWLALYKETLNRKLTIKALNILSFFAIADLKDSDFIYFIGLAVPWVVEQVSKQISVTTAMTTLEWSKSMCEVVTKLLKKDDEIFRENVFKIAEKTEEVYRIIFAVYELETELEYGYLTVKAGLSELNILKGSVSELHALLLKIYRKTHKSMKNTLSWDILFSTVPNMSVTLLLLAKNFDKYNQAYQCSQFAKNIMRIFSNALATTECEQIFRSFAPRLLAEVIFPAFIFTQVEETSFNENNQQFIHCVEDIIGKHLSQTLKSLSAELLEQLCDWIPGMMTQTIKIAVDSIKTNLNILEKQNNQLVLHNLQSLIIIGVLGYCCEQREDIAILLGDFFCYNSQVILKTFSPMQLAVLYIVLDYSGGEFKFPEGDYGFVYLKHSSICRVHPTTQFAALSFLSSKINQVSSIQILRILLQRTQNCGYGMIWNILQDFVKHNHELLPEEVAIELVKVVMRQIEMVRVNYTETSTYSTMQCINILRQLCDPKANYLQGKSELRDAIFEIFSMFKIPKGPNTDDVIGLLNDFVKKRKQIDSVVYQLIPDIDLRLKENEGLYINLFPFINLLIIKGTYQYEDVRLLKVLEWCLKPLGFDSYQEFERAESLLLLQVLLDKYITLLSPNTLVQTLSLLNQYNFKLSQPPANLRLLATNVLFYTTPINMPKRDLITKLLSLDFTLPGYSSVYMKKIVIIFLFKIIYSETQLEILSLVMNGIVNMLANWKVKKEVRSKKQKDKIEAYNLKEYKASCMKLVSPYKKIDIFEYFTERINEMKTKNPDAYNNIVSTLPEDTRLKMKDVLLLKQMHDEKKPRVIFKVKGIKQDVVFEDKKPVSSKVVDNEEEDEKDEMEVEQNENGEEEEDDDHNIKKKKEKKKQEATKQKSRKVKK